MPPPPRRGVASSVLPASIRIPLASHRLMAEHPELSGGLALQIGFGAGLVFAAQVVVLP
jgi:3-oxoacyl-[acyl-carrier-protein] synthase-3